MSITLHTATPWYVTWFEEYTEIHIQSAPLDEDSICEGLRNAMSNAKLIVESVNEKTNCGDLLINQHLFDEVGI